MASRTFASFTPEAIIYLDRFNLSPTARKLYMFLLTVNPFGKFLNWGQQRGVTKALSKILSVGPRAIQFAKKALQEQQIVLFSSTGFRIVININRPPEPQAAEQLDIFSWARSRSKDRDRSPEASQGNGSGPRKEPDILIHTDPSYTLQNTAVCTSENTKAKGSTGSAKKPVKKKKSVNTKPTSQRSKFRARDLLEQSHLAALSAIGVAENRIGRHLATLIKSVPWERFQQACDYILMKIQDGIQVMNPAGYLVTAIKNGYRAVCPPGLEAAQSRLTVEMKAWIAAAYEAGILQTSTEVDGERIFYVYREGSSTEVDLLTWEEVCNRYGSLLEQVDPGPAAEDSPPAPFSHEEAEAFLASVAPGGLAAMVQYLTQALASPDGKQLLDLLLPNWKPWKEGTVNFTGNSFELIPSNC